jgi:hypothetical protein
VWGSRQTSSMATGTSSGLSGESATSASKSNAASVEPTTDTSWRIELGHPVAALDAKPL